VDCSFRVGSLGSCRGLARGDQETALGNLVTRMKDFTTKMDFCYRDLTISIKGEDILQTIVLRFKMIVLGLKR
jgi:hypothetical protein